MKSCAVWSTLPGTWIIPLSNLFHPLLLSVQSLSHVRLFATLWTAAARLPCPSLSPGVFATLWTAATRLPCLSLSPGVYSNSCSLSRWCHLTISSFVITFSSCLLSLPASGSFPMSQFFASGGQSIESHSTPSEMAPDPGPWSGVTLWLRMALIM